MQSAMVALCLLPQSHAPSREAGSFVGPESAVRRIQRERQIGGTAANREGSSMSFTNAENDHSLNGLPLRRETIQ